MRTEKGKGDIYYELDKKATIWKIDGKERLAIRSIRELPDSSSEDEAKLTSGEEDEEDCEVEMYPHLVRFLSILANSLTAIHQHVNSNRLKYSEMSKRLA